MQKRSEVNSSLGIRERAEPKGDSEISDSGVWVLEGGSINWD